MQAADDSSPQVMQRKVFKVCAAQGTWTAASCHAQGCQGQEKRTGDLVVEHVEQKAGEVGMQALVAANELI